MRKKLILFVGCFLLLFSFSGTVSASLDDPLGVKMAAYLNKWVIKMPDNETPNANPQDYCLNLLSYNLPSYGTNLTRAHCVYNSTQYFYRMYATANGTLYRAWAPVNDDEYAMNCRRVNATGSYVNVIPIANNPRGDLTVHSPLCIGGSGTYFLGAPPRLTQSHHGGGMVVVKTSESTGYSYNYYLVWRPNVGGGSIATAHTFYQYLPYLYFRYEPNGLLSHCIHY